MRVGTQFTGSLNPGQTRRWFTHSWPQDWHVVWYLMPTTPQPGSPQIEWNVAVERASASAVSYWLTVKNIGSAPMNFEGRYAVLNGTSTPAPQTQTATAAAPVGGPVPTAMPDVINAGSFGALSFGSQTTADAQAQAQGTEAINGGAVPDWLIEQLAQGGPGTLPSPAMATSTGRDTVDGGAPSLT
jgi:hypothetical protein